VILFYRNKIAYLDTIDIVEENNINRDVDSSDVYRQLNKKTIGYGRNKWIEVGRKSAKRGGTRKRKKGRKIRDYSDSMIGR